MELSPERKPSTFSESSTIRGVAWKILAFCSIATMIIWTQTSLAESSTACLRRGSTILTTRNTTTSVSSLYGPDSGVTTKILSSEIEDRPPCDQSQRTPLRRNLLLPADQLSPADAAYIKPVTPRLTHDYLDRIIIVPEYKLFFCYMEKVGCLMFNNVFRLLRLYTNSTMMTHDEAVFQAQSTWFRNKPDRFGYNKNDLEAMLSDPGWTKAVFYRDPRSRFVSAYINKCIVEQDYYFCKLVFGEENVPRTWDAAIQMVENRTFQPDAHFGPQGRLCGGVANTLDYYDLIQDLERDTVEGHVQTLFQHIGVPTAIQQKVLSIVGRGGAFTQEIKEEISGMYNLSKAQALGSPPDHDTNYTKHRAGYRSKHQKEVIQRYYYEDYNTFNMPIDTCNWK